VLSLHTGMHNAVAVVCRYISHFLTEVPCPSPQRPRIMIQVSASLAVIYLSILRANIPMTCLLLNDTVFAILQYSVPENTR